jgi:tetratricopeptide (TPR) repeat protein
MVSNNLALALCEQEDDAKKDRARQYAEDNLRQSQQTNMAPEAASTYGRVLYKLHNLDAAEQALRLAAQSGYLSPDTEFYMAQVLYDRAKASLEGGHKDEAKARLTEARNRLDNALKNTRPFAMKPDAQQMLEKVDKELAKDTPKAGN